MPILIDGWNLIRNERSDIDDVEEDAVESAGFLLAYLADFQKAHRDPIIVVFDSSREFLDLAHKDSALLTVVPAKDADEYIKRFIDRFPERQRRALRVVSSDNDIYFYAKSSYATPVRCEEFWDKLRA